MNLNSKQVDLEKALLKIKELEKELANYKRVVIDNQRIHKELEAANSLYQSLIESLPQNAFQKNLEGQFILANTNFCKSLGKPLSEILGKTDYDFYPKNLADKYRKDDLFVLTKGEIFEDIEEHKAPNGSNVFVHVLKSPIFDLDKNVIGLQCMFWDVQKFSKVLEQSEVKFSKLVESANDAIIIIDTRTGKITDANKKSEELLGYPLKQLIGKHYLEIHPYDELEYYKQIFDNAVIKEKSTSKDIFVLAKDGRKIPVGISSSVTMIGSKRVLQAIIRDFTDIKLAEEKENRLKVQLIQSERLSSVGLLGAGIAHELNSPLTGILTFLRLRRKDSINNPTEHMKLDAMVQAAEHMGKIISDLSAFSKGSNNEYTMLNLNDLIDSTLSFSSQMLTRQDVKIIKNYSDVKQILGDKSKIQQVVLNMITNAKNALVDGGEFIINTYNEGNFVCMEFVDDGCGIDEDNLNSIFDPFFTTRFNMGGTGLGLFVSKGIITSHKGEITVESKVNKGTKFKVILPVAE